MMARQGISRFMYATEEGGTWHCIRLHSFVTPEGDRWDEISGWGRRPYDTPIHVIEDNQKRLDQEIGL
jgi:hypothetical protein